MTVPVIVLAVLQVSHGVTGLVTPDRGHSDNLVGSSWDLQRLFMK